MIWGQRNPEGRGVGGKLQKKQEFGLFISISRHTAHTHKCQADEVDTGLRVLWEAKWLYFNLSVGRRREEQVLLTKEVLFCVKGRIAKNPSLLLVSKLPWEEELETWSILTKPWMFRRTHGTSQFGLSSLGARQTRQPRVEVGLNLSFFLSYVVWHHNLQVQPTLLPLLSYPFCAYSLIFPMLDSKLLAGIHCLVISIPISNSLSSAHSTRFCGSIYCKL